MSGSFGAFRMIVHPDVPKNTIYMINLDTVDPDTRERLLAMQDEAPFPPHDGSGPDVNPATGDERETTDHEWSDDG